MIGSGGGEENPEASLAAGILMSPRFGEQCLCICPAEEILVQLSAYLASF